MRLLAVFLGAVVVAAWSPNEPDAQFGPEIVALPIEQDAPINDLVDAYTAFELTMASTKKINIEVTDEYTDAHNGVRHVWFRQTHQGLSVVNAVGNMNIAANGQMYSSFHRLTEHIEKRSAYPSLSPYEALEHFVTEYLQQSLPIPEMVYTESKHDIEFSLGNFSVSPVYADLMWIELENGDLELIWQVNMDMMDHWYELSISAVTGETIQLVDLVHWFSYEAFPMTTVDPEDSPGLREILPEIIDPVFSPLGWHNQGNGQIRNTQGNNVRAQENLSGNTNGWENNYRPTANAADQMHFNLNLNQQPTENLDPAITNLFYHCNVFHDVYYQAGFNEVSGNFQANNFGRGGAQNDPVTAHAQDGSGTNNANFATPTDGSPGRMRMYVWSAWNPRKDGDFDSGIIYHEYAHGLSNRLTGGPNQSGCLSTTQSGGMGEGWGDFTGLMFRTRPTHNRNMVFGTGSYVVSGITIRNWPYSSDRNVAPQTYSFMSGQPVHQVGAVWATILFEVYWNFVDAFGFSPDWHYGVLGNNIMIRLVVDGMKGQPCRPLITQARDAILNAALVDFGTLHWCIAWQGFASRGLGTNAGTNFQNGFNAPAECAEIVASAGIVYNLK